MPIQNQANPRGSDKLETSSVTPEWVGDAVSAYPEKMQPIEKLAANASYGKATEYAAKYGRMCGILAAAEVKVRHVGYMLQESKNPALVDMAARDLEELANDLANEIRMADCEQQA